MENIWDLLSKSYSQSDERAMKVLEWFKAKGYSRANGKEFVSALLREGTNDSWRYCLFPNHSHSATQPPQALPIRAAGSWTEGVSVGQTYSLDGLIMELDIMFTFGWVSQFGSLIPEPTVDCGYYLIRVRPSLSTSLTFLDKLCLKRGGNFYLSPAKTVAHVEEVVRKLFTNCEIHIHSNEAYDSQNSPVVTIKLSNMPRPKTKHGKTQDLMFDFAPVLETDMKKSNTRINFLNEVKTQLVLNQPLLLVAKSRSDMLQWRLSTSLAEREIFRLLAEQNVVDFLLKTAKLAKYANLRTNAPIKSYHLKTTLLHWLNDSWEQIFQSAVCANNDILPLVVKLYDRLCVFIESGQMPHFFYPEINLLADVDLKSESIIKFCEIIKHKESLYKSLEKIFFISSVIDDHESEFESMDDTETVQEDITSSLFAFSRSQAAFDPTSNFINSQLLGERNGSQPVNQNLKITELDLFAKLMRFATIKKNKLRIKRRSSLDKISAEDVSSPALHIAAVEGDEDVVQFYLAHGSRVNEIDEGKTPLYLAVMKDHYKAAELLIKNGADVNCICNVNWTPLLCAVALGLTKMVELLIKHNADVNYSHSSGTSCLFFACYYRNKNIVKLLLENGANVNGIDAKYKPNQRIPLPLESTIISDRTFESSQQSTEQIVFDIATILLQYGAQVEPAHGWSTPLVSAAYKNFITVVQLLLAAGSNINRKCPGGKTALNVAARQGHKYVAQLLLEHGADMNTCDESGVSAVLGAAEEGFTEVVKLLCTYGADINHADSVGGNIPLLRAVAGNHVSTVSVLLENGANVNIKDLKGNNALHFAAAGNYPLLAKHLLHYKADLTQTNSDGYTPLHTAGSCGSFEVVKVLLEAGSNVNAQDKHGASVLHVATFKGWLNIVELLIEFRAVVNLCQTDGTTSYHIACLNGHTHIVEILIASGADFNLLRLPAASHIAANGETEEESGLAMAARCGHIAVVKLLLETSTKDNFPFKIDVNQRSEYGNSALHAAVCHGHYEITRILLEYGANIEEADTHGRSPIWWAIIADLPNILGLLLDSGANREYVVALSDISSLTPLAYAIATSKHEIVNILIKKGANVNNTFLWEGRECTPLLCAVQITNIESNVVCLLLQNGAFANVEDVDGDSPLHIMAYKGRSDIAELLVRYASEINRQNKTGVTPLIYATRKNQIKTAEVLVLYGADINICDNDNNTAIKDALISGNSRLVECLLQLKFPIYISDIQYADIVRNGLLSLNTVIPENSTEYAIDLTFTI